jgi:hypothetical protein
MSTRGVIGYRAGGKDFLHYNHQDSYPSQLGLRVLAMIRTGNLAPVEPDEDDDATEFIGDSVMCQYAYIFNLDDQTLEYYIGVNSDRNAPGRYVDRGSWTDPTDNKEYYGVRLAKVIPFDTIRNTPEADRLQLFNE